MYPDIKPSVQWLQRFGSHSRPSAQTFPEALSRMHRSTLVNKQAASLPIRLRTLRHCITCLRPSLQSFRPRAVCVGSEVHVLYRLITSETVLTTARLCATASCARKTTSLRYSVLSYSRTPKQCAPSPSCIMTGADAVLEADADRELAIDGGLFGLTAHSSLRRRHSILTQQRVLARHPVVNLLQAACLKAEVKSSATPLHLLLSLLCPSMSPTSEPAGASQAYAHNTWLAFSWWLRCAKGSSQAAKLAPSKSVYALSTSPVDITSVTPRLQAAACSWLRWPFCSLQS